METKIKPQELRIGNWIEWDDDSHEQFQVESIKFQKPNFFVNGGLLDDMLPIPLSEEWLIRFGKISWLSHDIGGYFVWFNGDKIYIKFVHSLQNFYSCFKVKKNGIR